MMQKDVHFYLTYALAMKVGVPAKDAEIIAWADQYTDDLTVADLHGIQTQSDIVGNWADRQVQFSVLVPFHFIPGSDEKHPWMTVRNNWRARRLVAASSKDLFQLGIALHGLQDTFSHETFSGWQEKLNSCFPWYYIESGLPNVGHAEMRVIPDVVNYVWTDPRNGKRVDNKKRAMSAAKATYDYLTKYFAPNNDPTLWQQLQGKLREFFQLESYDKRVDELCALSGNGQIDFKKVNEQFEKKHKADFIQAARNHLALTMRLFRDLPSIA
jgi:hypothetical protein